MDNEIKNFIASLTEDNFKASKWLEEINKTRSEDKKIKQGSTSLGSLNGLPTNTPLTIIAIEPMKSRSNTTYIGVKFAETDQTTSLRALLSTPSSLVGYELENGKELHHEATDEDLKVTFSGNDKTVVGISGLPTNDFATAVVLIENGKWNPVGRKVTYYGKAGRVWKAKKDTVAYNSDSVEVPVLKGQSCAMLVPVFRMA